MTADTVPVDSVKIVYPVFFLSQLDEMQINAFHLEYLPDFETVKVRGRPNTTRQQADV
jgi:hypothetical protein